MKREGDIDRCFDKSYSTHYITTVSIVVGSSSFLLGIYINRSENLPSPFIDYLTNII
jgi:hypothetical protein